ncbi:MAG TPA: hybrid sensor histidine kinase/response regulator [Terriglobia bacterium]|nr:hybrid sensor histidine kinase/response regulator [Terriglobia bacterium]
MGPKDHEFLKKLLATFKVEAEEHVKAMSSGLIKLEKTSASDEQMDVVEMVFREAHSLKGAARAVNMVEVEAICQSLESVFSALKRQDITVSPALFDRLHKAVDTLGEFPLSLGTERTAAEKFRIAEISRSLEGALKGIEEELRKPEGESSLVPEPEAHQPSKDVIGLRPLAEEKPEVAETVRVSRAKLDSLLRQAEELLSAKLTGGQRAAELRQVNATLALWDKERAKVHPDARALQQSLERDGKRNGASRLPDRPEKSIAQIAKVLEFLEWNDSSIQALKSELATLAKLAEQDHRAIGRRVDDLLEDMKKVSMLPFSSLLEVFPKLVRDLSRGLSKDAELVIQGSEIEIDRRILEEMKDPLVHLVRNCIDHGIEVPKERERKKKSPRATITIAISPKNGDKVEIRISDDGTGLNLRNVRGAALKLGIISQKDAEKLSDVETLSLVFQSGVSTSPILTETSGRGLGLAIVREKVEKLGGIVSLETHPEIGTTFRMVLPLTLATFRGILVRVEDNFFGIPTAHVERVLRVSKAEIKTVENREAIQLNGKAVSLVRLGDVLELARKSATSDSTDKVSVVVVGSAERRVAFLVDEVLSEQEILVKSLGKQLSRLRNIAGATVLGTGKVVPVLNVPDLMQSAVRVAATTPAAVRVKEAEAKRKSILVAEDSITARTLLKNILESAGYQVRTAVDGVDAFTALRTEEFDLVVSDVDMPRMSGFDLTAKIRADRKLSELPVVLVTALQSREDRERGVDVGASAYIVKSSFDQSNLLEVVRRLI